MRRPPDEEEGQSIIRLIRGTERAPARRTEDVIVRDKGRVH